MHNRLLIINFSIIGTHLIKYYLLVSSGVLRESSVSATNSSFVRSDEESETLLVGRGIFHRWMNDIFQYAATRCVLFVLWPPVLRWTYSRSFEHRLWLFFIRSLSYITLIQSIVSLIRIVFFLDKFYLCSLTITISPAFYISLCLLSLCLNLLSSSLAFLA